MRSRDKAYHGRLLASVVVVCVAAAAGPLARMVSSPRVTAPDMAWDELRPGVLRSRGIPSAYAITSGSQALVIDLPRSELLEGLDALGLKADRILLTHHHRHTADGAKEARRRAIPVWAPKAEADWLTPEGVAKFWRESVPLRNSRTAYLVLPEGIAGIEATLEDGQEIEWRGWLLRIVATPGHSTGHVSVVAKQAADATIVFCGGAMAAPGTIATPFTLDWDHWTDIGAKPAAASLERLASLEPDILCPAHADPIQRDPVPAIRRTQAAVAEVAFLKSFERFSERLGDPPSYRFLTPDQVATSGDKPWSQVSDHLFITGNTYILVSETGRTMAVDLWGKRSVDQVQKLVADRGLTKPDVVWVSHAHYDHYDGIYETVDWGKVEVWTLARTAEVLEAPGRFRAPFLDGRPIPIARKFQPGDEVVWNEYRFRIHHLPGQTVFTMGIETTIDGRRCFFSADNFFHMKQFSGSGGWTGLNRALPGGYAASARTILDIAPDWVLAEHGGPFEFNKEDFRRRVAWSEATADAADRLAPSGNHRRDWDPHRVAIEPALFKARPGDRVRVTLRIDDADLLRDGFVFSLDGRGRIVDQLVRFNQLASTTAPATTDLSIELPPDISPGRHVFAARVLVEDTLQEVDTTVVVDVE